MRNGNVSQEYKENQRPRKVVEEVEIKEKMAQ